MADATPPEDLSPAERRLQEHLTLLRAEPPRPSAALVPRVIRTARWQRVVRPPARVASIIAMGVVEGVGALLGLQRRRAR